MTCDQRNMFKATFHKHNIQALEQSHKPTTTINHSSLVWENTTSTQNAPSPRVIDAERDNICEQQSKANVLLCCFICGPHRTSVPLR